MLLELSLLLAVGFSTGLFLLIRGVLRRPLSAEELAVGQVQGYSGDRVVLGYQSSLGQTRPGPPLGLRARLAGFFQPMADRADRRATKRGRATLDERLNRADLKMTPQEFIMLRLGCMVAPALLGLLRFGPSLQVLVLGVVGYASPGLWLRFRQRRRVNRFNDQLPEVLLLLANSMRAGQSFPQAITNVAERAKAPTGIEFSRVVREINLGGSVDDGLANLVKRIGSEDLELVVTAVSINRSAGGNLAEMLEIISTTIRQRVQTKREIRALTAQGRMSGWFITLIPVIVAVILYFISPDYFRPMTASLLGWVMLAMATVLLLVGNLLIRKAVSIEA
jgi:tight adherence protein B